MIRLILNVLWLVCGGWISGLLWLLGGAVLALTVVGLPWTFAAWRMPAIPSGPSAGRSSGRTRTPSRAAWASC